MALNKHRDKQNVKQITATGLFVCFVCNSNTMFFVSTQITWYARSDKGSGNKHKELLLCQRHVRVVKVMVENASRDKVMAVEIWLQSFIFLLRYQWYEGRNRGSNLPSLLHVPENHMASPDTLPVVCVCLPAHMSALQMQR